MESISAAQLEPESVEEIDLSTNGSVIGVAEQTVGITLSIIASRGSVLHAEVPETVLTAKILRGATDLTSQYDASRFSWTRSSLDAFGDTMWNATHRGTRTITVTAADVKRQAVFHCTLEEE